MNWSLVIVASVIVGISCIAIPEIKKRLWTSSAVPGRKDRQKMESHLFELREYCLRNIDEKSAQKEFFEAADAIQEHIYKSTMKAKA